MRKHLDDLKVIREMMERSSKFISLSGLSGVLAGVLALAGAIWVYIGPLDSYFINKFIREGIVGDSYTGYRLLLIIEALILLGLCLGVGFYFSNRKAKKNNERLINQVSLRVLYHMSIPLIAGGIICLLLMISGQIVWVVSLTLIFYGLALVNASKNTYDEVHYLGLTEIIVGLCAALYLTFDNDFKDSLVFWGFGFGICHIIYGTVMYYKYDQGKS